MKVLFLDIDGPLVNHRTHLVLRQVMEGGCMSSFDPIGVGLINLICEETGAEIVVSSTWRFAVEAVRGKLVVAGIRARFHEDWRTPHGRFSGHRGREIAEWMREHPEVLRWCAIDDDVDFEEVQKSCLVSVDPYDGISFRDYQKAVKILGAK